MQRAVRRISVLASGVAIAAGALLSAPASATVLPKWVKNPAECTSPTTKKEYSSSAVTVQVRAGRCNGTTYFWARANNNYKIYLDLYNDNYDRVGTNSTQNGSGNTHYTQGRRTESGWHYRAVAVRNGKSYEVTYHN